MDLNTTPRSINPMQQLSAISTHRTSVQLLRTILRGTKEKQSQDKYIFRRSDLKPDRTKPKQQLPLHVSVYKKTSQTLRLSWTPSPPTPYSTTMTIKCFIYDIYPQARRTKPSRKEKKNHRKIPSNLIYYQLPVPAQPQKCVKDITINYRM